MTLSPARVPGTGPGSGPAVRRLSATLYGYAFLDDFVLLYPVYALLFSDTGLTVWQISSLFCLWSLTGVLLEIPSGAWADAVSRRLLLWFGPLLTAAGFILWVLAPSYWAFALGFVLWGAKGALGSGALEALVYEELDRLGAADRYAAVMGRARAAGLVAVMAAIPLAGPVYAFGGYPAVGLASVLACLLTAATATRFPEHREPADGPDEVRGDGPGEGLGEGPGDAPGGGWTRTLRAGLAEARGDRSVRGALLLVPAVTAVWGALDEYTPLLVRDTGVAESAIPNWLLLIWAGATVGGLLAGAGRRLGTGGFAGLLAVSAVALAAGAWVRTPAGIGLVALSFCGFQLASVLADARLQDRIGGTGRATLTSVAGVGTDLTIIAVYGAYGVIGSATTHGAAFALFAMPYLVTAALLAAVGKRAVGKRAAGKRASGKKAARAARTSGSRARP
ncbi:MFS family permease [Streptomyces umbrinus]|uniref:MFS transporter n=1 Tax=Streptomyces umbrinus TaxID=67370 RepID=UPI00167DD25A|nr:MFS transporter [Streptomyces umbrinus]MCR3731331.1 MFS family permease [Streptomyces umbrinus]GHH46515.1 MFS transporter [Streptomyces umbrinus]